MNILEREPYLAELTTCLERASRRDGQLVFLGGEAGIGKTALVEQFVREARKTAHATIVSCDGLKMPGPFGPIFDIAEALGPEVERLLAEQAPREQIFRAVLAAFRAAKEPTVLVGEDAHWTDEATLELIRFVGKRIGDSTALFVVTYRDDEIGPHHPLRRTLGDLATAPAVRRIMLPPLSLAAVTTLTADSGIDPAELHRHTGGNPFFVTETIGSGSTDVPATVRDAVLARASRLSPEGRALLDAAAAIGVLVDPELLAATIGGPIEDMVEECLAVGMLRPSHRDVVFRHGITRDVVLETMSPPRRRALHRRILDVMQARPEFAKDLAHLAHHAEAAGDGEAVLTYAVAAARDAAVFGAHKEAAAQYARALRFAEGLSIDKRTELMELRAYACYLTGELDEAITVQHEVVGLWRAAGDRLKQGNGTRWLSRYYWFSGQNQEANRLAQDAHALLAAFPPGPELAMACSNLSQLRRLSQELPEAIAWGERAIALATACGDEHTLAHALTNVGSALLLQDDARGMPMLERSLEICRRHGFDDDTARALTNLAWTTGEHRQLDLAQRYQEEGLAFASERDLVPMELYLRSMGAMFTLARGRLQVAQEEAETVLRLPLSTIPARIVALTCVGRVRALRGDDPADTFDEARSLAAQTGELQRIGPVASARAEAAWLGGDMDGVVREASDAFELAVEREDHWRAGDLGLWLHRAGQTVTVAGLPEPFPLEVAGDGAAAAAIWNDLGYPLEAARALSSTGSEDDLRRAYVMLDGLGARADAARIARQLRDMGARNIPRGPRSATRANAASLTARELEVLALLAVGGSNREIADRLYLSPKTVGHHVSSILGKLDAASRGDAVRHAQALGLLQDRETTTPI